MRANPSVLRLAANPLLLTMLALLRRQGGRLPDERIRLYQQYVDMLLDSNWENVRSDGARTKKVDRFDRNLATSYLAELALWLQRHRPSGTARRRDLELMLVEIALKVDGLESSRATEKDRQQARDKAILLLQDTRHFTGLLAERGQDAFGFLHLTFQEYFAGRALAKMEPEERWALLKDNLHRPRWREPLLLCAGQLQSARQHQRASSLSLALDQIRANPVYEHCLKIAVWHHPVHSTFPDRITDHGFLARLANAGFRLSLHGHIHKPDTNLYRYDMGPAGRRIELVCAGTFGAPIREWVPGYPLQYQLLRFGGSTVTVETRRREEINGTWKPDARWTTDAGKDPAPRYCLTL